MHGHCRHLRVVVLLGVLGGACAHDPVRIDGTSPASFTASHRRLIQSLSPADQTRLTMAEMIICAAAMPKPAGPGPPADLPSLQAVRAQLDGKSFKDILQLSKSLKVTINVGFTTPPDL